MPQSNHLNMAGQEGFEPPTYGFGDRRSSRWSYCPIKKLLCFAVKSLFLVPRAILHNLQTSRRGFFVFVGGVVASLAFSAC